MNPTCQVCHNPLTLMPPMPDRAPADSDRECIEPTCPAGASNLQGYRPNTTSDDGQRRVTFNRAVAVRRNLDALKDPVDARHR